jgi:hypothetical protein
LPEQELQAPLHWLAQVDIQDVGNHQEELSSDAKQKAAFGRFFCLRRDCFMRCFAIISANFAPGIKPLAQASSKLTVGLGGYDVLEFLACFDPRLDTACNGCCPEDTSRNRR